MENNPISPLKDQQEDHPVGNFNGLTTVQANELHQQHGPNTSTQLMKLRNEQPPSLFQRTLCACIVANKERHRQAVIQILQNTEDTLPIEIACLRDGKWSMIKKDNLVPGDIICVKRGSILPADCLVPFPLPLYYTKSGTSSTADDHIHENMCGYTHYFNDTSSITGEISRVKLIPTSTDPSEVQVGMDIVKHGEGMFGLLFFRACKFYGLGDNEHAFDMMVLQQQIHRLEAQIARMSTFVSDTQQNAAHIEQCRQLKVDAETKLKNDESCSKAYYETHTSDEVIMIIHHLGNDRDYIFST